MSTLPADLLTQIEKHEHYRGADYAALAEMLGAERLQSRIRSQLGLYELDASPIRRAIRPVYRGSIQLGFKVLGLLKGAQDLCRKPEIVIRDQPLTRLPEAFDGYRILHLSDFHFDFVPELPELLPDLLKELDFDVAVLTGDFRGEDTGPYENCMQCLSRCRSALGDQVYAVLGNHDNVELLLEFPKMDIRSLINDAVWLEREGARMLLAGVDDSHYYRTHDFAPIRGRMAEADCTVLLSHSPEAYKEGEAAGADFMLSGHTHGGQICLPGGIPVIAHLHETPRDMIVGPWTWKHLQGYTSRGVGASSMDLRLNCAPEITVHVLRCVKSV